MRGHAHRGREGAREVEYAETCHIGKISDCDIVGEMLFDVVENSPQTSIVERMSGLDRRPNDDRIEMRMQ